MNCNGIDEADEMLFDPSDPVCLSNIDPATGEPYDNTDRYFGFAQFGCRFPIDERFDTDGDGLTFGLVYDGFFEQRLDCDNCPSSGNANQSDADNDGIGDVCIDALHLGWPSPGVAGVTNDLVVLDATPGALVKVVVANALGIRSIPGCSNALSLDAPVRVDIATASDAGAAIARRNVPQAAAGSTVYLQAVEPATCRVSNVVAWTF